MDTLRISIWSDDTEMELDIPAKYEVCDRCNGRGTHVNPSIDGNGLTASDFDDRDFMDDYFAGRYDVKCYECGGKRVVKVPDIKRCKLSHRMALAMKEKRDEENARYDREDAYIRRMECGGY